MLTYETQASFDDKAALRREADDIWEGLKKEAEAARLKAGVIRAVHAGDDGTTQTTQGYGFAFVKREDGKWHNLEDEKRGN